MTHSIPSNAKYVLALNNGSVKFYDADGIEIFYVYIQLGEELSETKGYKHD